VDAPRPRQVAALETTPELSAPLSVTRDPGSLRAAPGVVNSRILSRDLDYALDMS